MPLSPGQVLNNRYRIVKLLGQGGFGAVYRAWDTNLDYPRALKENFDTSLEAQRQFKREAQILTALSHPNLPHVIDHFVVPGQGQYLIMDYIEGEDLGAMLEKAGGPLPELQVLEWASQVCDALEYLHSRKPPIIHRDIKPANIKITPEGKAILVDFGIAKVYDANLSTTAGARAVTPGYSPQEQYGLGTTDARTDVYALGATLYHLLTGKQPVESVQRTMGKTLDAPISLNSAISPDCNAAILEAMAPLPEKRYQNIADFRQDLLTKRKQPTTQIQVQTQTVGRTIETLSASPVFSGVRAHPSQTVSASLPWKRRGILTALGLIALLVIVFAGFNWLQKNNAASLTADDTATLPAVAIIATTRIPFSPTFPPATSLSTPIPSATPTETLTPTPLPTRITDDKGIELALVPAGEFQMGSDAPPSRPVHAVYLDPYYIDSYEVTNALYLACVQAGACTPPNSLSSSTRTSYYAAAAYADYPVIYVDWSQARAYCQWRGGDLPTEAQWEKAARGGLEGKKYPWGDEFPVCQKGATNGAQFGNCSVNDTGPVGSYAPNGYGLYDMAGNVWEWVLDWYHDNYSSLSAPRNPLGPSSGDGRVLRGGSWNDAGHYLTSTYRGRFAPSSRYGFIGLRCSIAAAAPIETDLPLATQLPTLEPAGTSTQAALTAQFVDDLGVSMALIPAGDFWMGSPDTDEDANSDEKPLHRVTLDAFYIDVYEVTYARYTDCAQDGKCSVTDGCGYFGNTWYQYHPVACVSWQQAQTYCRWRGGDLPTEAQWEKAARGGLEGKKYPWGDEDPVCGNDGQNGANFLGCGSTTVVGGSYAPNGFGLFDMAGNVWEWVLDRYDETYYSSLEIWGNPLGPNSGQYRLLRGGSWYSDARRLRTSVRYRDKPSEQDTFFGFRCARSETKTP